MKSKYFKRIIFSLLICGLFYVIGISSVINKHFPYNLIEDFFYQNSPKKFKYGGRNFNFNFYTEKEVIVTNKTGVYLTYGQSNSVNGGELGYINTDNVFQFLLGSTYIYKDPSLGGTGLGASVWGRLGDKLIENKINDNVIFSNSGWNSKSIKDLKTSHFIEFLIQNYKGLVKKYGRVDAILFHQGEADYSSEGVYEYYDHFIEFYQNLKDEGIQIPIYLSRASICGENSTSNENLIKIQNLLIKNFDLIKEGPNTDLLVKKEYRLADYCHFSDKGLNEFSKMWFESLTK